MAKMHFFWRVCMDFFDLFSERKSHNLQRRPEGFCYLQTLPRIWVYLPRICRGFAADLPADLLQIIFNILQSDKGCFITFIAHCVV
jgi:hypothetical protein